MVINNEEAGCHETARFRPLHQQSITLRLSQQAAASYCGLTVKLIAHMESCRLIRYRDRESIVETGDLRDDDVRLYLRLPRAIWLAIISQLLILLAMIKAVQLWRGL